jgi:hypothetical protein
MTDPVCSLICGIDRSIARDAGHKLERQDQRNFSKKVAMITGKALFR